MNRIYRQCINTKLEIESTNNRFCGAFAQPQMIGNGKGPNIGCWWELDIIMISVFQFVDIKSNLPNLSAVCKKWHRVSNNPLLWKSLHLNTNMINNLNLNKNINLQKWKDVESLHLYVNLDVDPFYVYNILNKFQTDCRLNNIKSLCLHIFCFDGTPIMDNLLKSMKLLLFKSYQTLSSLRLEFGHGLTMSILGNSDGSNNNFIFQNVKHLIFDRITQRNNLSFNWPSKFPNITHLSLNYASLNYQDFVDLSRSCQNLKYLSIFMLEHEWMTIDKTISVLSLFGSRLIGLQMEYPRFEPTNEFFVELSMVCPNIEVLYFWWWSIANQHYDIILRSFTNLQQLGFAYSSVTTKYIQNHNYRNTRNIPKIGLYGNLINVNANSNHTAMRSLNTKTNVSASIAQNYLRNANEIVSLFV